ncbi:hypothetical protein SAMN04488132_101417 [Sediminibacterium ginsengisoli]|uniref:Uncharacterized protein n=1 Tax=Sediminibacterium ginsengisoli TaxID=413434 RepID=A0A1T4K2U7_9BACT|nr:hypothetical protein SAMN04488132_101417 [Sediminibacterium ginsengisoli]
MGDHLSASVTLTLSGNKSTQLFPGKMHIPGVFLRKRSR